MSWHHIAAKQLEAEVVPTRNGPALWDTILEAVGHPKAVIAGGCIRDFLLGLEPKDIDIFVPCEDREALALLIEQLNDTGIFSLTMMELEDPEAEEYAGANDGILIGGAEGEALGLPVNIIARYQHLDGAWDLIESFDYGILQWSFSSTTSGIVCTAQALMDLAARTATLTRSDYYQQSLARYERFAARNPGALRLVDPFAQYAIPNPKPLPF